MLPGLSALQVQRWFVRVPAKTAVFAVVVFFTLYPHPALLGRHVRHARSTQALTDPAGPAALAVREQFDRYARQHGLDLSDPAALRKAVEAFVYARVAYAWDWDTWGVADYLPSLAEVLEKGREDCDGRAVMAAALLRTFGTQARLVADPRHVWVRTPDGDLMNPLGPPAFQAGPEGVQIRWRALLNPAPMAFGVAVFPWARELIILLTAWLLLLPPRMNRFAAALVLALLLDSLVLVRLAGADPVAPRTAALVWAAAHWPVALWMLWRPAGAGRVAADRTPA